MQAFDPSGRYGDAAVIAALQGRTGARTVDFRYDLLNRYNVKTADLVGVISGSVSQDSTADVKRTATFTLRDGLDAINYLSDRIRPWVRLLMPDGGWVEWPQGVFLLSSPTRTFGVDRSVIRTVDAYDQLVVLSSDAVGDRYSIPAGQAFTAAVAAIVYSAGITYTAITPSTLTLPVTWDYEAGTSKLTILNDLLSAMNYRSAWFNENGALVCEPYLLPDQRPTGYTYATDAGSVLTGAINQTLDLFNVPNRWTLVVSDTDQGSFSATVENSNPASPTSIPSRGRTILAFLDGQSAADQATLAGLAAKQAHDDSQVFESFPITTAIMPFHSNADMIGLTAAEFGITATCEELSWSMDLTVGGTMSHTLQRTISTVGTV